MAATAIRLMRADEIEQTARMWQRSQLVAYTWFREDQRHPFPEALAFFRDSICKRCDVWVAAQDDASGERVVGMLALEGNWIDHLYVDADCWEHGIGTQLLNHAMQLEPEKLELVTLQKNERARRFYESRGFVTTKFGTSPPPENEPDVFYRWTPEPSQPEASQPKPSQGASQ